MQVDRICFPRESGRKTRRQTLGVDALESRFMLSVSRVQLTTPLRDRHGSRNIAVTVTASPVNVFQNEIDSFQASLRNGPLSQLQNAILPAIASVTPPSPSPTPGAISRMQQAVSAASQSFVTGVDGPRANSSPPSTHR